MLLVDSVSTWRFGSMNAALNRPALNMTILVSVIFHLAVLYYLATTWNIIPPTIVPWNPPAIRVVLPQPPPPIVKPDEKPPIVAPHHAIRVIDTPVPPVPLPPQHVD